MLDMNEMLKVVQQIEKSYAEDRYTDIDGLVWLGTKDERWYVEGKEAEEDPQYWLTNPQMHRKMVNELSGDEQFRREEVARREAQYEYAVDLVSIQTGQSYGFADDEWTTKAEAEEELERYRKQFEDQAARGSKTYYTVKLVKRRKAGPVVDA